MSAAVDQFAAEYQADREARLASNKNQQYAWEKAQVARVFQANVPDPTQAIGFFQSDVKRAALPYGPVTKDEEIRLDAAREDFVRQVEEADAQYNGEIPLSFLMDFDPQELAAFRADELGVDVKWLYEAAATQANHADFQAKVREEAERRIEGMATGNSWWENAQLTAAAALDVFVPGDAITRAEFERQQKPTISLEEVEEEVWREFTGTRDEVFEADLAAWRERERKRLLEKGTSPDVVEEALDMLENSHRQSIINGGDVSQVLGTQNLLSATTNATGEGVGKAFASVMNGAGMLVGGTLWAVDGLLPGSNLASGTWAGALLSPYDYFVSRQLKEQQALQAEFNLEVAGPIEERVRDAAHVGIEVAWKQLQDEDPELFNDMVEAAGGEMEAMGFFGASINEGPEAKEQLANLSESIRDRDELILEDLSEQDFRISNELMDVLAMWGRNVPGRLSTGFTALLFDSDYWDPLVQGKFAEVWHDLGEDIEKHDFRPSSVVGLDGSLAGLGMDFGMGVVFDPTTWFFGPRFGGSAIAKGADDIARIAQSAPVRRMVDDIINFSQSQSRGASSVYHLMSWLDPIARGEMMSVLGVSVPKTVPGGTWASHSTGKSAQLVSTETLVKLIPEEDLAATAAKMGMDVEKATVHAFDEAFSGLGDDIAARGFEEAGTITISRADGSIHVTDGLKRIMAANSKDIRHVPMRLRVVDDAAVGHTAIPGFDAAESTFIQSVAEGAAKVTVEGADEATREAALAAAKAVAERNPGVAVGQVQSKAGNAYQLFRTEVAGKVTYYAQDAGGNILATTTGAAGKVLGDGAGISTATAKGTGGGLMEQLWDVAAQNGDHFILQTGKSGSLSSQGAAFAKSYANKLMENAVGNLTTAGRKLDDIWDGGLKKELKQIGDGSEVIMRPDQLISGEFLLGKVNKQELMSIAERAIARGAKPTDGARSATGYTLAGQVARAIKGRVPYEMRSFMTKANTTTHFGLYGSHNIDKLYKQVIKMWGDDVAKADEWMQQLMDYHRRAAVTVRNNEAHISSLRPLQDEVAALLGSNGGALDDAWRTVLSEADEAVSGFKESAKLAKETGDDVGRANARAGLREAKAQRKSIKENHKQVQEELAEKMRQLEKESNAVQKASETMPDQSELAKLIEGMWNDFNATKIVPKWKNQIAKHPEILKELEDGTKIVDWKYLQRGHLRRGADADAVPFTARQTENFFPESLTKQMERAGMTAQEGEKLMRQLNNILDTPMAVTTPLSPLDMIAASTTSGKGWTLWTQTQVGNAVREATQFMHRAWVIDKVIRPATAMTVSGDELLRIFHEGGYQAVGRYVSDRALFTHARIQTALHGGNPLGREAVRRGARYSPRTQERLRKLDEMSMNSRQFERVYYDDYGIGWSDIRKGDPDYLDAAKRWTGDMLQQSGFRAFLRGEDDFKVWYNSVDGESIRNGTVIKKTEAGVETGPVMSAEEAYKGWETLFDNVVLARGEESVMAQVREAFRETATRIDGAGGKAADLPDWVFEHLGDVRGTVKNSRARMSPLRMSDAFFDRAFLDPVNYRRGFVADMVAKQEKARLMGLYNSQGLRVVSDLELARGLGMRGVEGASRTGVKDFLAERALARGMVPESHIDELVQRAVDEEIDHMLYVADEGRRAGNVAAGTLFPFGRPFADMAGFWWREMFRRPHWRGFLNEQNTGIIGDAVTAGGRFNPRTPALVSRLAATDMNIDQGWVGEVENGETKGLLPGSEATNLAPLLFLPTAGENPFYSMIPGMGYVPMWALDRIIANVKDPDEDPLGYQQLIDNVGDIIGGAHFGNADPLLSFAQRFVGGGTFGQLTEASLDVMALFGGGGGYGPVSTVLGQPDREIDRGRYMSVVLSDEDTLNELLKLEDDESIDLMLAALANEADSEAAKANLFENVSRFALPTNNKYNGELDEIHQVWLDAGTNFPELAGVSNFDPDKATPEERRQVAGDVRSAFFDLPQGERDRLITEQPSLAVNLISSWEWTDKAHRDNAVDTSSGYRTDGSRSGLIRHDTYIERGFVRPLSPQERGKRIVGLILSAKESTAKRLYEVAAANVNDLLWKAVSVDPETTGMLQGLLNTFPQLSDELGIETPRELWQAWGSYEEDFEETLASIAGIDPVKGDGTSAGETAFDRLRAAVRINPKLKPWGTSYPGFDRDEISERMKDLPLQDFLISDEMMKLAAAIDVDITPNMTGGQLYNAVHSVVASTHTPVRLNVSPAYNTYVGERGAASRAADLGLRAIATDQEYAPEWRQTVDRFMEFEMNAADRYRQQPLGTPPRVQREVQDRFMKLMNTADDNVVADWAELWKKAYARSYGPLGWTPPEPLSPFDEEGGVIGGAYQPFIQNIIDGDSLVVTDRMGARTGHEVRLLGVRARDYGIDDEGAELDKDRLWDRLQRAIQDGDRIYLVRQPDLFGNVDIFGRELAWLWIGDEPFYFEEEMLPNRDPSAGGEQ